MLNNNTAIGLSRFEVIIVGGGPCGIALGLELGLQNVKTLILEKHEDPLLSPRAQSLSARTMELFMRWQIDNKLKANIVLPADYPIRGIWCSQLNGKVHAIASSNDLLDDTITMQRGVRIPLWITEGLLRDRLHDFPSVTFLKQHEVTNVTVDQDQAIVTTRDREGQLHHYKSSYVIGCDGANSVTRRCMSIPFQSLAPARRVINLLFQVSNFEKYLTVPKGFIYYLLGNELPAAVGPVDPTRGIWYAQIGYPGEEDNIADVNVDHLLEDITGIQFEKEILQAHFWNMHIHLSDHYSAQNRVFLVGDSAHGFVPTGGFGLNTGFGDVTNLSWKLSAVLHQGADPALLNTYELERRPVGIKNLQASQKNADDLSALRQQFDPQTQPAKFAEENAKLANQFTHSLDLMMGYAYLNSPLTELLENQETSPIKNDPYQPRVAPGYFLPHRWLAKNHSIYRDLSPIHWTLIISGDDDCKEFVFAQTDLFPYPRAVQIYRVPVKTYPFRFCFA